MKVVKSLLEKGFYILSIDNLSFSRLISCAFINAEKFFSLSSKDKDKVSSIRIHQGFGYVNLGSEQILGYEPDHKDFFELGRDCNIEEWNFSNQVFLDFCQNFYTLYQELNIASKFILDSISLYSSHPSNYLSNICDNSSITTSRFNHYPNPSSDKMLCAPHEDNTVITMVIQSHPALQILNCRGNWISVEAKPNEIVCLLGNMIDKLELTPEFKPTTHRGFSQHKMQQDRFSIAHFVRPNADYLMTTEQGYQTAKELWHNGYDSMTR